MIRKIIAGLIILIGILVAAYPKLNEFYENYQQQKLLDEWMESILSPESEVSSNSATQGESEAVQGNVPVVSDSLNNLYDTIIAAEPAINQTDYITLFDNLVEGSLGTIEPIYNPDAEPIGPLADYDEVKVDGILTIDKIDLKLPIIKNVTTKNLRISVASFANGAVPGQMGNYSIAGHRNHTYGRNFNRLDEVEIGNTILLTTKEQEYEYTVVDTIFVKPSETWVLDSTEGVREITLITCHPMGKPTGRLIVKGRILK